MGKEKDPCRPPVTPVGMTKMTVVEGSGTAPAPREAAPPSTLAAGVKLTEEREATLRLENRRLSETHKHVDVESHGLLYLKKKVK